ncbi:hypothetical protein JG687_00013821 [Phytophthora cactorum]|uniref:Uncharacterized protein n=1 Tax=Phytophthora cactorum TaxID=29920 RepID=A0A8T1U1I0_9STRA|nr:hypothetical protein JG687_00013821 [Phytophthora cactorum]
MLNHYTEGRWVSAAVARAQTLVQGKDNYSVIKGMRAKFVKPILFNASKFIVSPKNIPMLESKRSVEPPNSREASAEPKDRVSSVETARGEVLAIEATVDTAMATEAAADTTLETVESTKATEATVDTTVESEPAADTTMET